MKKSKKNAYRKNKESFFKSIATMLALSIGLSGCNFDTDEYDEEHEHRLTETASTTEEYHEPEHDHDHGINGEYIETIVTSITETEDIDLTPESVPIVTAVPIETEDTNHENQINNENSNVINNENTNDVTTTNDNNVNNEETIGETTSEVTTVTNEETEEVTTKEEHKHKYTKWKSLDDDQEYRECSCGEKEYRDHTYSLIKTSYKNNKKNKNHTVEETYKCTSCNHKHTITKEEDHTYGNWRYLNETQEYRVCTKDGHADFKSHEFGDWIDNGDETETRTCNTCQATQTRDIKKEEEQVPVKPPVSEHSHELSDWACYNDEYEYRKCYNDDFIEYRNHRYVLARRECEDYNDDKHKVTYTYICETCKHAKTEVRYESHNYRWTETEEAKIGVCHNCGHTVTISQECIHQYGQWEYENGQDVRYCSKCGGKETRPHEHNYSEWIYKDEETEERTCLSLRTTHKETQGHNYVPNGYNPVTDKDKELCTSCHDEKEVTHSHKYTDWQSYDDEKEYRVCSDNGLHIDFRSHTFGDWIDNGDGTESHSCSQCGHKVTRPIAHTHTLGAWEYDETNNKEVQKCTDCHDIVNEVPHTHSYSVWAYKDENNEERICTGAHITHTETQGHNYVPNGYNPATDKDKELCTSCHNEKEVTHTHKFGSWTSYDDNQEYRVCSDNGIHIEYRSHTYGDWVDNGDNTETKTCSTCNHTVTRPIAHTHTLGAWEYDETTGKEVQKCTTCTETVNEVAHNHNYSDWAYKDETTEERTCTGTHITHTETQGHNYEPNGYNPATDKDKELCTSCHNEKEVTHTHKFGSWTSYDDDQEYRVCSDNGVHIEYRSHTYGDWVDNGNNTETKTCSTCSHTVTRPIAHTHTLGAWEYDETTGKEVQKCTTCTEIVNEVAHNHNYSDWAYKDATTEERTCTGTHITHTETQGHSYGDYVYNPTTGEEVSTCTTCGDEKTRGHVHTLEDDAYTSPTYVGDNKHTTGPSQHCTVCGETIPAPTADCTPGEWVWDPSLSEVVQNCTECGHQMNHKSHSCDGENSFEYTNKTDTGATKKCTICGATTDHSHVYETQDIDGSTYDVCQECGYQKQHCTHKNTSTDGPFEYDPQRYDYCTYYEVTCTDCGLSWTEPGEKHTWIQFNPENLDEYVCIDCMLEAHATDIGKTPINSTSAASTFSTTSYIDETELYANLSEEDRELLDLINGTPTNTNNTPEISEEDKELLAFFDDKKKEQGLTLTLKK